jgi:putative sulfotransferase
MAEPNDFNLIAATGRCGSTITSKLLMFHPDACVPKDMFSGIGPRAYTREKVSGEGLAALLGSEISVQNLFLNRGITIPEVAYRLTEEEKRSRRFTKPSILLAAMPYVTNAPDALHEPEKPKALYEEILEWAREQPIDYVSVHWPNLFKFLLKKSNKKVLINCGAGIDPEIFPNPRVCWIHRDGPENALSYSKHTYFRLMMSYQADPPSDEELQAAVDHADPDDPNDPIRYRLRDDAPRHLELHARSWSTAVANHYRSLQHIQPSEYMEMRFEHLSEDPKDYIKTIADFFQLPDRGDGWIEEAMKILRPVERRMPDLSPEDQALLERECFIGQVLTGRYASPGMTRAASLKTIMDKLYECHDRVVEPLS